MKETISIMIKNWLLIRNKRRDKRMEHDRNVFFSSNRILTERDLIDHLEETASLHSYRGKFLSAAERYYRYFEQIGNQYLDRSIRKLSKNLHVSLYKCISFLSSNFSPSDNQNWNNMDEVRFLAWPKYQSNIGPGDRRYDYFVSELEKKLSTVAKNYREYRDALKRKFFI